MGYTAAGDTVLAGGGAAGSLVFKWVKLTGVAGPAAWTVPAGALTQTFQWGSREDGMFMDKLAFGRPGVCYTVADLDAGRSASGTCPPPPPPDPPPYTRTDPPIATGQDKFLGAAWSPGTASLNFANYWNQVTPENGGKWGTVEGTRNIMNWAQADEAYAMAKTHGFVFKWHTLVWGNQQPNWIAALPPEEQLAEIQEWYAAIAARYPRHRPDRCRQRTAARASQLQGGARRRRRDRVGLDHHRLHDGAAVLPECQAADQRLQHHE